MPICSHDEIADRLGVPAISFEETYPEKAKEMKMLLLEYIKTLQSSITGTGAGTGISGEVDATAAGECPGDAGIAIDQDSGFPIAPRINTKVGKGKIERLYRLYITEHYRRFLR
jgi:hypothetical protein